LTSAIQSGRVLYGRADSRHKIYYSVEADMADVGAEALDLLTVKEVATRLRVSEKTVRRLIYAEDHKPGEGIKAVHLGSLRRIAPEEVLAYKRRLRGLPDDPAAPDPAEASAPTPNAA
jgi:excisionase family DNA binding protein